MVSTSLFESGGSGSSPDRIVFYFNPLKSNALKYSMDYGKVISNGLRFAVEPKRWLPFFAIDAMALPVILLYVMSNASVLTIAIESNISRSMMIGPIISFVFI